MTSQPIRIATRKSPLAMWQAEFVKAELEQAHPGIVVELVPMVTKGDIILDTPLAKVGGKGLFVKELEVAMLEGRADIAVHSMKDVPVEFPEGLGLVTICEREDPRDCLLMREGLKEVEPGHVLATSSPRRRAFLKSLYPENKVIPLRGNVNTRLRKLHDGEFHGMVLSYAGLLRLGLEHHVTKVYSPEEFLPAVGQGVVCLKVRKADVKVCEYLRTVNNTQAEMTTAAEREMLWVLKGDCHSAIAGHCTFDGERLRMRGIVAAPVGSEYVEAEAEQSVNEAPEKLGAKIAQELIDKGANKYLGACARLPLYS